MSPSALEDHCLICLVSRLFCLNETDQVSEINWMNKKDQADQLNPSRPPRAATLLRPAPLIVASYPASP